MARKITTEIFIEDAKKVHGDKYNYEFVEYKNAKEKVTICCNSCNNVFKITPNAHKNGQGCRICGIKRMKKKRRLSQEEFIDRSLKIHGNKYSYYNIEYKNAKTKVKIYCKSCKRYFLQTPDAHMNGRGCNVCGTNRAAHKRLLTKEQFIKNSNKTHNNKYIYNKVIYLGVKTKVEIYCPVCKEYFFQTPTNHTRGRGCPICGDKSRIKNKRLIGNGFSPTVYGLKYEKSILYILNFFNNKECFYKIGITSKSVIKRFCKDKYYDYIILYEKELSGFDARSMEIQLHKLYKKYKYRPQVKFSGYTECFNYINVEHTKQLIQNLG